MKMRLVDDRLIQRLRHAPAALREIGANDLAEVIEEVCLTPECPAPSWPQSIYVLDRIEDVTRDFLVSLSKERDELSALSATVDKQTKPPEGRP